MAAAVIMPRQGQSVESCLISKWHKKKGDIVKTGDLLFSYETDKASFDEEAKIEGTILEIFFSEGDDVACLTNVCAIGNPGEDTEVFRPGAASAKADTKSENFGSGNSKENESAWSAADAAKVAPDVSGMIKVSPRAKNLAENSDIDYRFARASGPDGRIIERDIKELASSGIGFTRAAVSEQMKQKEAVICEGSGIGGRVTSADLLVKPVTIEKSEDNLGYVDENLSNIRKVIARTMNQSLSTAAQLTLNTSFDATNILEFRKQVKENKDRLGLENITMNDIVLYAVSRTLKNHRALNAYFLDDKIRYFSNVNLGVAIDTDRGLMVPTVFAAEYKSLNQISGEVKKLVKECQSGTINPDLLKGGSFTVTNLGTLGIESFTPVLNPPQTGILGVNNIVRRSRDAEDNTGFYPAMGLSLTFDHRALDGAPAARFLQDLVKNLENFSVLLVK